MSSAKNHDIQLLRCDSSCSRCLISAVVISLIAVAGTAVSEPDVSAQPDIDFQKPSALSAALAKNSDALDRDGSRSFRMLMPTADTDFPSRVMLSLKISACFADSAVTGFNRCPSAIIEAMAALPSLSIGIMSNPVLPNSFTASADFAAPSLIPANLSATASITACVSFSVPSVFCTCTPRAAKLRLDSASPIDESNIWLESVLNPLVRASPLTPAKYAACRSPASVSTDTVIFCESFESSSCASSVRLTNAPIPATPPSVKNPAVSVPRPRLIDWNCLLISVAALPISLIACAVSAESLMLSCPNAQPAMIVSLCGHLQRGTVILAKLFEF